MLNHLKVTYTNTTPHNAEIMANCIMQGAKYLKIKMRKTISPASSSSLEQVNLIEINLDDEQQVSVESVPVNAQVQAATAAITDEPTMSASKAHYDFVGVAG